MSVFSRLFHLFPGVVFFGLALLHAAWSAPAEGRFAKGPLAAPILAGHDYDPISDAVASWTLKPGESIGQSFTVPANGAELRRFRLKLLRVGTAPACCFSLARLADSNCALGFETDMLNAIRDGSPLRHRDFTWG